MKRLFILVFIFIFILVGCSDANADLDTRLINLEKAMEINDVLVQDYEQRIKELEEELLYSTGELNKVIRDKKEIQKELEELQKFLQELKDSGQIYEIKVFLADEYYLTVDNTFQLFYRSVIQAQNPYGYYIRLKGTVGHAYNRYYEFTPTSEHLNQTYNLTLEVCDDNGRVYGSKQTKLIVSQPTAQPKRNILCIGDSLTANGYWLISGYDKYIKQGGGEINFIGTIKGTYGSTTQYYEGRSGWQWSTYLGAESPFYNAAKNGISFAEYAAKLNVSTIDELYILLTWNGIGGSFREFDISKDQILNAKKFIDQYHKDYPNGKVTLLGIPQPSVNAGLGAYYTIGQSYGDNYGQFVTALNYNKALEDFAKRSEYKSFVRYIDVKGQFDSEYNMPASAKPVNSQSSTTEQVGNSMGMHPTTEGYLQIGEVFYRALSKKW